MPSAKPVTSLAHKSLYDTSVHINAIRSRSYYEALLPHFSRSLPSTHNEEDFALIQRYKRFRFAVV